MTTAALTKPTITFLTTSLAYGGAANQIVQLAVRLKQRGWGTSIISITAPEAFADLLADEGVPLESLDVKSKLTSLYSIKTLIELLNRWRPSILHTHLFHANLVGRLSRPFHKLPLVSTIHSVNEGGRHRELAYQLTDSLSLNTTIISQRATEHHIRRGVVSKKRSLFIPNGVDIRAFSPQRGSREDVRQALGLGDALLLLTVGRFVEAKDYPNLFHTIKRVVAQRPDLTLLVVGTGELEKELHQLVRSLDIEDHVRFLGTRTDIPKLMNAADLYVMASAWEGLPMVLLEASACALPIVSTDVGGVGEIVTEGQTGYLAPPQNPQALAEAILKMIDLPEGSRKALGQNARRHTEALYDFDKVTTTWENLYLKLLARENDAS